MAAATSLETEKKKRRMSDEKLWSTRMATLIERLIFVAGVDCEGRFMDSIEKLRDIAVEKRVIHQMVLDPIAISALEDLDIDREEHSSLADLMDPDNGGTIPVIDFVEAIRRLRGQPRRSDIVGIDLMVRSVQATVGDIQSLCDCIGNATKKAEGDQRLGKSLKSKIENIAS